MAVPTPLPAYTPSPTPILEGGGGRYAQSELLRLKGILDTYLLMLPQAAAKAPTQFLDGMIRLARDPWRPAAGQVADAWVYYDAAGAVWHHIGTNPTNT